MKFIVKTILTIGLCFVLQLIFPFWVAAIATFLINLIIQTGGSSSFFSGFVGVFILWLVMSTGIDTATGSILTDRIAQLFYLNGLLLLIVTSFIGGLVGGFGALTGSMAAQLFSRKRENKYYT